MSFSQQNKRLNEEPEYRYAFLTTKNGNSIRRFRTCTFLNLQFPFFSAYSGDTRSPIPVISVHSVGNLQYLRQS